MMPSFQRGPVGMPPPPSMSSPETPTTFGSAPTNADTCETCKFYRSDGRCQRFPPHGQDWSMVTPQDWCGEFMAGPQKEAPTPEGAEMNEGMPGDPDAMSEETEIGA